MVLCCSWASLYCCSERRRQWFEVDSSVEDNVCVRSFLPTTDLLPPWNGARGEGRQRCEGECTACRPHVCVYSLLTQNECRQSTTVRRYTCTQHCDFRGQNTYFCVFCKFHESRKRTNAVYLLTGLIRTYTMLCDVCVINAVYLLPASILVCKGMQTNVILHVSIVNVDTCTLV